MKNNFNFIKPNTPYVTLYDHGYVNKSNKAVPSQKIVQDITLTDVYRYIISDSAKAATETLRLIDDHTEAQKYKMLNFMTMTPAGTFERRNAQSLKQHSELMVIDIDDITSHKRLVEIREQLINDPYIETELLFVSPSGNGLKWIICVGPQTAESHKESFCIVRDYLIHTYGIEADKSGSDVCRLCYLPYDPDCYINPDFLM